MSVEPTEAVPPDAELVTSDDGVPHLRFIPLEKEDRTWDAPMTPAQAFDVLPVRQVVQFIVDQTVTIPFHLYRRVSDTDRQRVTDHPVAHLLKEPCRGITWPSWLARWVRNRELYGWAGARITLDDEGRPSLVPLSPVETRLGFVGDPRHDWELDGLADFGDLAEVQIGKPWQTPVSVPLDQVLFDREPNPTMNPAPSPVTDTLAPMLHLLLARTRYRKEAIDRGYMIPAVVERPKDAPAWSDEAYARFKQELSTYRIGGGNQDGIPVLEDGMRLVMKRIDPMDFDRREEREAAQFVAMAFGVIPEWMGMRAAPYAGDRTIKTLVVQDVIAPRVDAVAGALNMGLRRAGFLEDDLYIEPNIQARLRGSLDEQARIMSTSTGAPWMTRNEARARENLPAVEGGDDLVTPLNVWTGPLPRQ